METVYFKDLEEDHRHRHSKINCDGVEDNRSLLSHHSIQLHLISGWGSDGNFIFW